MLPGFEGVNAPSATLMIPLGTAACSLFYGLSVCGTSLGANSDF